MKVSIIQKPVYAMMSCENCFSEMKVSYDEFIEGASYIYDLEGSEIECNECGHVNIIEEIEYER